MAYLVSISHRWLVVSIVLIYRSFVEAGGGRRVLDVLEGNGAGRFGDLMKQYLPELITTINAVPHTIFAPPDSSIADWLARLDQSDLEEKLIKRVLRAHIVKDRVQLHQWKQEMLLPTLTTGLNLRLGIYENGKIFTVSGIPISKPNLRIQNSVIHLLDGIIFPLPATNVLDTARVLNTTNLFLKMVQQIGVQNRFRYDDPITAFIPRDEAFGNLPDNYVFELESPVVSALVQYHLVHGSVDAAGLVDGGRLKTQEGSLILVKRKGKHILLNENCLVLESLPAANGVLHITDCLLNPPANPKQMMYENKGSHGRGGRRLGEI